MVGCAAIEYVQKRRLLTKELLIPTDKMGKAVETIAKEMEASATTSAPPLSGMGCPAATPRPLA